MTGKLTGPDGSQRMQSELSLARPFVVPAAPPEAFSPGLGTGPAGGVPEAPADGPAARGRRRGVLVTGAAALLTAALAAAAAWSGPDGDQRSGGHAPASADDRGTVPAGSEAPAGSPQPARYTAVAGESCGKDAARGYHVRGWHSDWYRRDTGGWTGDGCQGRVVAVPMSGVADHDDEDNVVVWWFRPPTVRQGSCAIDVYVPKTGNPKDAAGRPAYYLVYGNAVAGTARIGAFTVDQPGNQGRWVAAGSFPLTRDGISVRMVTRGVDWGVRQGDHLGVSALRADCRAGRP